MTGRSATFLKYVSFKCLSMIFQDRWFIALKWPCLIWIRSFSFGFTFVRRHSYVQHFLYDFMNFIVLKSIANVRISAKIYNRWLQALTQDREMQCTVIGYLLELLFFVSFIPMWHFLKHRQAVPDCNTLIFSHKIKQRSMKANEV